MTPPEGGAGVPRRTRPGGAADGEARRRAEGRARLFLLRHGEPDWAPGGVRGVRDPTLTGYGAAQARAAAQALAREGIDAIYASPLRRAQQTARPLAEETGVEPVTVAGLAEIGIETGGMSQPELDRFFVAAMQRPLHELWDGYPGGERFRDFHARVTRALAEVLAFHGIRAERSGEFTVWEVPPRPQSLVIVAHGGTNGVLLTQLLDLQPVPWEWLRFEMELAAYAVLRARPVGPRGCIWSLADFNEIDPLRAAGLR